LRAREAAGAAHLGFGHDALEQAGLHQLQAQALHVPLLQQRQVLPWELAGG
jgi:hypothetical protein